MFFLLWGNSGFCVNVHYCRSSQAFSVMVNDILGEKCGSDDMKREAGGAHSETAPACCQKLRDTLPRPKKDCCSDTEVAVKMAGAYQGAFFQLDIQKQWHKVYIPFTACFLSYIPVTAREFRDTAGPPDIPAAVCPSGRHLLIDIGVFRI